jgi:hypothetical protein
VWVVYRDENKKIEYVGPCLSDIAILKISTCQNRVAIAIGPRGVSKKFIWEQFYLEEEAHRFLIFGNLRFIHSTFFKFVSQEPKLNE